MPEHVEEQVFRDDREKPSFHIVPEMSVQGEITEEDMMRKILFHEVVGHGDEAGSGFHGKCTGVCRGATRRIGVLVKRTWEERDDQECPRMGWQEKDWR